jgi:hypothetical protein
MGWSLAQAVEHQLYKLFPQGKTKPNKPNKQQQRKPPKNEKDSDSRSNSVSKCKM